MIRVLCLIDVPNWAFARRAEALRKYAPPDIEVTVACWPDLLSGNATIPPHDVVFQIDSACLLRFSNQPHIVSWNSDPNRRGERWQRTYESADFTVCNNQAAWEHYGRRERTCCISNGVDTDVFKVTTPIEDREDRIFWTGSSNPAKRKGYDILLAAQPELESRGFIVEAHPVESAADENVLSTEEMVAAYNRSGYVLCLSESEATPNTSLEAMACGCALVTVPVGNIMEIIQQTRLPWPAFVVDRTVEAVVAGVQSAHRFRWMTGDRASRFMRDKWSYGPPGNRAAYFYSLFRAIASGRTPSPFCYAHVSPEDI
jgi:glycosyltransferase involved in cell wall biosynthesis